MPPIHRPIDLRSDSPDSDISEMVTGVASGPPSRAGAGSPARPPPRRAVAFRQGVDFIELDDSDDEIEIVGGAGPSQGAAGVGPSHAPPAPPRAQQRNAQGNRISQAEFNNTMEEIDAALARRREAIQHLHRLDNTHQAPEHPAGRPRFRNEIVLEPAGDRPPSTRPRYHNEVILEPAGDRPPRTRPRYHNESILEPAGDRPPPTQPPRTGLGGAVYRRGNEEIRFAPGQRPQRIRHHPNREPEIDPPRPLRSRDYRRDRGHPDFDPDYDPTFDDFEEGTPDAAEPPALRPRWALGGGQQGIAHLLRGNGVIAQWLQEVGDGRYLERAFNIVPGLILQQGGAGPARQGQEEVAAILAKVETSAVPPPQPGFTRTWDADDLAKEDSERAVIQIDDEGSVIPSKRKPYLACAVCPEPLRVSAGERSPDDRVWALRCGHVLDQRCFQRVAWGVEEEEDGTDKPSKPKKRKTRNSVKEFTWSCPVVDCGREHVSRFESGRWTPKEGAGGIQVYV